MIWIGHWLRMQLTKLGNIVLIIITTPPLPSFLCLLWIARPGGYTVNLCDFYFYKIIGKLTAFFQLQEFSLHNITVVSSTSSTQSSPHRSNRRLGIFSLRLQHYGSFEYRRSTCGVQKRHVTGVWARPVIRYRSVSGPYRWTTSPTRTGSTSVEPIRATLFMKIFDEYTKILKGMYSIRFNVPRLLLSSSYQLSHRLTV